jgi:hypothetical protein
MVAYVVDSTKVGTALVSAAGAITSITVAAVPTTTDKDTQVRITDGLGGRTLVAATISALAALFEPRPGVPLTPGLTAPTFPRSLFTGSQAFANGLYVASCPTGMSFTVNA